MQIIRSQISENRLASAWSGVTAAQGSSVFLKGSLFENNEGLMVGTGSFDTKALRKSISHVSFLLVWSQLRGPTRGCFND